MSVRQATRRIGKRIGSSYLTRGADNYDHSGLNKARRALSSALIAEQIELDAIEKEQAWNEYIEEEQRIQDEFEGQWATEDYYCTCSSCGGSDPDEFEAPASMV